MNSPKVSIVAPVFNGTSALGRLLDSIDVQNIENYQVLIIDNASTDATAEISRAAAAKDLHFIYLGPRQKALLELEMEFKHQPTYRPALELKTKLQRLDNGDMKAEIN